jgi:hypothetical protein
MNSKPILGIKSQSIEKFKLDYVKEPLQSLFASDRGGRILLVVAQRPPSPSHLAPPRRYHNCLLPQFLLCEEPQLPSDLILKVGILLLLSKELY